MRTTTRFAALLGSAALLLPAVLVQQAASAGQPGNGPLVVDSTADAPDASPGDGVCATVLGDCTLRAALDEANTSAKARQVNVKVDAIQLTSAITVTGDVTVKGDTTITAAADDRILDVSGGSVELRGLTLVGNGVVTGDGGIVRAADAELTVKDSTLIGGTVAGAGGIGGASGGAIRASNTDLDITSSTIADSTSARAGGGIEVVGGTTSIKGSTLTGNDSGAMPGNGGALHVSGPGFVEVKGSLVSGNTAIEGGGLWVSAVGTMVVKGSTISDNVANGTVLGKGGGGLFNQGGTLVVKDSTISGNSAPLGAGSGGGILATGTTEIVDTLIVDNDASRAGGGIEATTLTGAAAGTTTLVDVDLVDNVTGPMPGNGGALHVSTTNDVDVRGGTVVGNSASAEGGGLWNNGGSTMTVTDTLFRANAALGLAADNGGGALFNNGGVLVVDGATVDANTALVGSGSGGGLFNDNGDVTITDTTFTDNSSNRAGGAIEALVGTTSLVGVTMQGNTTGPVPGNGGGLHLTGAGTVTVDDSLVRGNDAANEGGGLWNSSTGTMTVTDTVIVDNTSPTGPNVFTQPGGVFTIDGVLVPAGQNAL